MTADNSQTYTITGMHCGGCVRKVEAALAQLAGKVSVTLEPPQAVIADSSVTLAEMNQALAAVGSYRLSADSALVPPAFSPTSAKSPEPVVSLPPPAATEASVSWFATYKPLLLVFGYILLTTLSLQAVQGHFDSHQWMSQFMAGFFLLFSFFKMLDIRGFASSYAMYDLLAMRWAPYGFIYPFIELALGIAYLLHWQPAYTNLVTLVVMLFSSLGVILAVSNKQKIRCACLGSVFNLPMSTVTIIEDLLMAAMAGWMLF